MNNSEDSIEAELATLDKLMDQTSKTSLLNTPDNLDIKTSTPVLPESKKRKRSDNDVNFTREIDQAFAEFNQTITEIYRKHNMTSQATWNASKRIMIMRQQLKEKIGKDKLL